MHATSDLARLMTVLKTYRSQIDFVGFKVEPSALVASRVLIKMALNSCPVKN